MLTDNHCNCYLENDTERVKREGEEGNRVREIEREKGDTCTRASIDRGVKKEREREK